MQQLVQLFDTKDKILSATFGALLECWLRTLVWTTYANEREHATVRKHCHGVGRARNWSLVADAVIVEKVNAAHIQRVDRPRFFSSDSVVVDTRVS